MWSFFFFLISYFQHDRLEKDVIEPFCVLSRNMECNWYTIFNAISLRQDSLMYARLVAQSLSCYRYQNWYKSSWILLPRKPQLHTTYHDMGRKFPFKWVHPRGTLNRLTLRQEWVKQSKYQLLHIPDLCENSSTTIQECKIVQKKAYPLNRLTVPSNLMENEVGKGAGISGAKVTRSCEETYLAAWNRPKRKHISSIVPRKLQVSRINDLNSPAAQYNQACFHPWSYRANAFGSLLARDILMIKRCMKLAKSYNCLTCTSCTLQVFLRRW